MASVSTQAMSQTDSAGWPSADVYRLSVDQYHDMIQAGILGEEDRVELLEGVLVLKKTKNPCHVVAIDLMLSALHRALPAGWFVSMQNPMTMADSEPEPAVRVVRGHLRDYASRHPTADETALVVEVADTSLDRDRGVKLRIYARAGVPCYWILNLPESALEVYSDPATDAAGSTYRSSIRYRSQDDVPLVVEGREIARIAVRDLLP